MEIRNPVYGKARKAALLSVLMSLLGWIIYLIFFGLTVTDKTYRDRVSASFLPHWLFLPLGPPIVILAIIQLVINGRRPIQTTINLLVAFYLLCGGAIIYTDWILYYVEYQYSIRYLFEFGSCSVAVAGMVFYTLFRPCFNKPPSPPALDLENNNALSPTEIQMKNTSEELQHTSTAVVTSEYVESPTDKKPPAKKQVPRVSSSSAVSPTTTSHPTNNGTAPENTPEMNRTYTSLIAANREQTPLYEDTNPTSPHPEDEEEIYMNDDEEYDAIMYEDVAEMHANEDDQEHYVDVSNDNNDDPQEVYAEVREEQYEVLNP